MEPTLLPPNFISYGNETWHCELCHRLVRWYDTDSPDDAYAALLGHRAFNCTDQPALIA